MVSVFVIVRREDGSARLAVAETSLFPPSHPDEEVAAEVLRPDWEQAQEFLRQTRMTLMADIGADGRIKPGTLLDGVVTAWRKEREHGAGDAERVAGGSGSVAAAGSGD